MPAWTGELSDPAATAALGRAIGSVAGAGDVIALVGDLGAGKTQLVRAIAGELGIDPRSVSSPTFIIAREHEPTGDGPVLVHVDAYRIGDAAELESIGWGEHDPGELADGAVIAVEWADRIRPALGPDVLEVHLAHAGATRRRAEITATGSWTDRSLILARRIDHCLETT